MQICKYTDRSRSDQLLRVFFPRLAPLNSHKVIFALLLCPDCSFRFETLLINQVAPGGNHLTDLGKSIEDLFNILPYKNKLELYLAGGAGVVHSHKGQKLPNMRRLSISKQRPLVVTCGICVSATVQCSVILRRI